MHYWAPLVQRFSFLLVGMMKYLFNAYVVIGLANKKTVTIQPGGKDQSVLFATTKTKNQGKPASLLHKSLMKKEFRRMAKAVKNQVELHNMSCSLFKFVIVWAIVTEILKKKGLIRMQWVVASLDYNPTVNLDIILLILLN